MNMAPGPPGGGHLATQYLHRAWHHSGMKKTLPALAAAGVALLAACAPSPSVVGRAEVASTFRNDPPLVAFDFFGCGADAHGDEEPEVRRYTKPGRVTFLVRHMDGCGLEAATEPTFHRSGDTLSLGYKLDDADGAVLMCDCMYEVGFTFDDSMLDVKQIEFRGERVSATEN